MKPHALAPTLAVFLLVGGGAILSACVPPEPPPQNGEGEDEEDLGPRTAADAERIVNALAAVDCAYAAPCVQGVHPEVQRMRNNLIAGRVVVSDRTLAACLADDAAENDDYGRIFDSRAGRRATGACKDLWIPRSVSGAACDTDFACVNGFCDRGDFVRERPLNTLRDCGVCVPRSDVGGPCSGRGWEGADAECRAGLVCVGNACAVPVEDPNAPLPDGAPCDPGDSCESNLCLPEGVCGSLDDGESCTQDWMCTRGSYCDAGTCAPTFEGSYCYPYRDGMCPADLVCAQQGDDVIDENIFHNGRCLAPLLSGELCVEGSPSLCPAGHRCALEREAPRCVQDVAVGEACVIDSNTSCVPAASCEDGVCTATESTQDLPPYCLLEPT